MLDGIGILQEGEELVEKKILKPLARIRSSEGGAYINRLSDL